MITIYHNPRCNKSRETLGLLKKKKADVKIVEYLNDTFTAKELKKVLLKLGMKPGQIIRKKEKLFQEKFAGKKFTDARWIAILVKYPILIERPIVVKDKEAVLGRPPENVLRLL